MREYQIPRAVHSADIGEQDFEDTLRVLQDEAPKASLRVTHVLWGGDQGRMCSARCYDRVTMSTLLYSSGKVMFVPGDRFKPDERLYAYYLLLANAAATTV